MAWIDEDGCIGWTLCIAACPVDRIVGSPKRMHTVIEADCTGCELCVPACPVDCIHMQAVTGERTGWAAWSGEQARSARARYAATQERRQAVPAHKHEPRADAKTDTAGSDATAPERKRAMIEAALARARQQRPGP